jgi:hypothetical protein
MDGSNDGYGYGYAYHVDCYIYFNYIDDACFMYVIVYRCKPKFLA